MLSENHIEQSLIAQLQGPALHSPVPTVRVYQVAPPKQPPKQPIKKNNEGSTAPVNPGSQ